jgi:hypothetical protein
MVISPASKVSLSGQGKTTLVKGFVLREIDCRQYFFIAEHVIQSIGTD